MARPNPDFQFKPDWLWDFKDGAPVMGWADYGAYLVFPAILVGITLLTQQQAQANKPQTDGKDEDQQLILKILPFISVYFIGALSLELPQAVSVYYTTNTAATLAQTALVKFFLRQEIPGYAEFEKTGKFPDSAFEDAVRATVPPPKTLHEAALRGDLASLKLLYEGDEAQGIESSGLGIDAWDEKEIPPIGYAVATGNMESVQYLVSKGANLQIMDGQNNSLLHYAAGYGHKDVLEELVKTGESLWPKDEWKDWKNKRGQTVLDAARVNRKGPVMDYLCERLGIEAPLVPAPPRKEETEAGDAAGTAEAEKARAALLAAAGKVELGASEEKAADAPPPSPAAAAAAQQTADLKTAVSKLKENPKAVAAAKKMMSKMPPQMLSMLSGGKVSADDAQKAIDAMEGMSTEELLSKAEALNAAGAAKAGAAPVPAAKAPKSAASARVVD